VERVRGRKESAGRQTLLYFCFAVLPPLPRPGGALSSRKLECQFWLRFHLSTASVALPVHLTTTQNSATLNIVYSNRHAQFASTELR